MSGGDAVDWSTDLGPSEEGGFEGHRGLGIAVVSGAVIQFIGQFTRYGSITTTPPREFGGGLYRHSYSLWSGLSWHGLPWFNATLLTLAVAGVLLTVRPSRGCSAFVVGFAGRNVGGFGFVFLTLARTRGTTRWGPGFFLNAAGIAIEVCVAVVLFVSLWRTSSCSRRVSRSTAVLVVASAVLLGISSLIWPVTVTRISSIARYVPWSIGSTALAVSAVLAAAALPILAVRLGGRNGASVTTGIAVSLTLGVLDAISTRLFNAGFSSVVGQRLTVGFWCEVVALALLLVLGHRQRQSADPGFDAEPATISA